MKNLSAFLECAHLYLQVSKLLLSTLPLQRQIRACHRQLKMLTRSDTRLLEVQRIRDLKDEIFGCDIERQVLRRQAQRLVAQGC